MRRSGLIGGVFKILVYGVVLFIVLSLVFPQLIEDPAAAAADGLETLHRAAETGTTVDVDGIDVQDVERQIHDDVNDARVQHGLEPLVFDRSLARIARDYSQDMAERGFFSHYSPEGESFSDRYEAAGYDCEIHANGQIYTGGENLALNSIGRPVQVDDRQEFYTEIDELSASVVTGWLNSPDHRENMLHQVWQRQGIGVHIQEDGTVHVTQNFC